MSTPQLSNAAATTPKGAREYWQARLSDAPRNVVTLPAEGAQSRDASGRATLDFALDAELAAALARLSNGSHFLLYAALLAGLKVCLHKYAGVETVVVGSPARRKQDGSFQKSNALAIVGEVVPASSFRRLLGGVRQGLLEAYAHQDYAYARVLRDQSLDRVTDRCPLFDVSLALAEIHDRMPEVNNGVNVTFEAAGEGLSGSVAYRADLFRRGTIERFVGHYQQVLRQMLAQPDAPVAAITLLTEEETRQLLDDFSHTHRDDVARPDVVEVFERQAAALPSALALGHGDERLTYAELNARANRLARRLRERGVGPEARVGIHFNRSTDMIVALLAVWKAGGAYVPLDPAYPVDRLAYMLEDSRAHALLTAGEVADALKATGARVIDLDAEREAVALLDASNLPREFAPKNAAYVIYTSGSTGRPKGVVVTHDGVACLVESVREIYEPVPQDRVMQFTSLSFDASVFEIVMALCHGASLWLASREELLPGPGLIALLDRHEITNVLMPPSVLLALPDAELPTVRKLTVAGEACPAAVVERWGVGRTLFNAYGPTEATVWSTAAVLAPGAGATTIGRPVYNDEGFILDRDLRPVPVGVVGELYIGGTGVSRGYLNRPELTAERFIPHHFASEPGARLYRTGDLARWLEDGRIEFLGRADEQVKVRGFRIELGEVEAVLGSHASVRQCVVVAREAGDGDRRLAAYLVTSGAPPTAAELRAFMQERLPEHMLPSVFVTLDALPLTPNGKVDRRALPEPESVRAKALEASSAAGDPVEEVLAGIWSDVLGVEQVGVEDNFLELGGHSLLATRVSSRIREAFQVEVPVKTLFAAPTVAALARVVREAMGAARAAAEVPIKRAPRAGDLPLSFGQQRLWFLHQLDPSSPLYNIPFAVRLTGDLNVEALARSLSEIVRRHEVLRTTFKAVEGRPTAVVAGPAPRELPLVDLSGLPAEEREAEVRRLATEEARRPFDLAAGPLLREKLLRLDEREHVLLVSMHHIVSDGWSLGVLVDEVVALYTAFSAGAASPLAELPVQYADYVAWQREWLQGPVLEAQLAYWKNQLEGAQRVLNLPAARPRPAEQTFRGETQSLRFSGELSEGLRALSRREGSTLFMTLMAGLQTLLYRYCGQDDITVGTPIANRTRRETESLIGFFINVLAVRTDLSGNPTFRELLTRVRRTTLGAYAHQDLPFEKVVGELQLERTLSHAPLFQVVFVLQNQPMPELELPGLTLRFVTAERGTSQADIYLSMTETPEGLVGGLKYNTDIFDAETMKTMLADFERLLAVVVSNPEGRLLDINLRPESATRYADAPPSPLASYGSDQFAF